MQHYEALLLSLSLNALICVNFSKEYDQRLSVDHSKEAGQVLPQDLVRDSYKDLYDKVC